MKRGRLILALLGLLLAPVGAQPAHLQLEDGCVVAVRPGAGIWEQKAATELVRVLTLMTGHAPELQTTDHPSGTLPRLVVGELALRLKPELRARLSAVAKPRPLGAEPKTGSSARPQDEPHPVLRADAVTLLRQGSAVYLAGTNDESHYFAVMQLLHHWGCRWYLPTAIGECIPQVPALAVGDLNESYAPPFEVRTYWISWNGDRTGYEDFLHHNFMNGEAVPCGHALSQYVGDLQKSGGLGNFSITAPETARHVGNQVDKMFARGERFSLSMEDGSYATQAPGDLGATGEIQDKFFGIPALSDAFLILYNQICGILQAKYPKSASKIGFLAYINLTLPPQRDIRAASPLVAYLAPIDIDPNHGIGDPRSPELEDYRGALRRWSEVMQGRVVIYDYDQGMLVWRDLPDPSFQAVQPNVRSYREAGILGVATESRNAIATTFLNLFFRGQLYWNPDLPMESELNDFYPRFYGPMAAPMQSYWSKIFRAWKDTDVTEHEYFAAPVIYTEALVAALGRDVDQPVTGLAEPFASRFRFTWLSYQVMKSYLAMVHLAAGDCAYRQAAEAGKQALSWREQLTEMNGTFTTYRKYPEQGPAFFPGEVAAMGELAALTDGPKGHLVAKTPLVWRYDDDPFDEGLWRGWAARPPAGAGHSARTDVYLQGQGLAMAGHHSQEGFGWYSTELPLGGANKVNGKVHLCFPGLFNEAWLYVNGTLVEHRPQKPLWWMNDYNFRWDCDLSARLRPGTNRIALRTQNARHFSGMFRRPFVYRD